MGLTNLENSLWLSDLQLALLAMEPTEELDLRKQEIISTTTVLASLTEPQVSKRLVFTSLAVVRLRRVAGLHLVRSGCQDPPNYCHHSSPL